MKKLIGIGLLLFCTMHALGQTTLMTREEWTAVMKDVAPTPFNQPPPPYRRTVRQSSFEEGDLVLGYTSLRISERLNRTTGRSVSRERIGTELRSDETVYIGKQIFSRRDDGPWVAAVLPSRTRVIRSQPDPVNPQFVRKPDSVEVLYYSLGSRVYKGRTVAVYEEVTRHILIRTADKTEVHRENRTRSWIADRKNCIRWDTHYATFDSTKTTRAFTSTEWELNPNIQQIELPIKQ